MEKNIPPFINYPLRSKRYGSIAFIFAVILIAGIHPLRIFGDWVPYSPSLSVGAKCIVDIHILHPTQFAVGYWEIGQRAKKVVPKNAKKMEKYLEEHAGKIVVGPAGEPYLIDRHHLACIMLRTGKSATIYATVEATFKSMTIKSFWKEMTKRQWVYLYDSKGKGPLDPLKLPKNIKDLDDDPFRSLAWAVRERGGFHTSEEPFAEFRWANFFRSKLPAENANSNMERLIQEALKLCRTPAAAGLPGYSAGAEK